MATDTLYVNQPGGVIAHLQDGTSKNLLYGDRVPVDELADYVDPKRFADSKPRVAVELQERDAHRRAALEAENGQVNSSSSPVPGNYSELDEDGAAQLVSQLAAYPGQQAAVLQHEILFGGNRQKVIDAAGVYAQHVAKAQIEALDETRTELADISDLGDSEAGFGDPLAGTDRDGRADEIQRRAAASIGKEKEHDKQVAKRRGSRATPPPSSGGDDGDTGDDGDDDGELTGDALDARAAELNIEGRSSMSAEQKRAAIAEAEASK